MSAMRPGSLAEVAAWTFAGGAFGLAARELPDEARAGPVAARIAIEPKRPGRRVPLGDTMDVYRAATAETPEAGASRRGLAR